MKVPPLMVEEKTSAPELHFGRQGRGVNGVEKLRLQTKGDGVFAPRMKEY